jgi:hypothetical protein
MPRDGANVEGTLNCDVGGGPALSVAGLSRLISVIPSGRL